MRPKYTKTRLIEEGWAGFSQVKASGHILENGCFLDSLSWVINNAPERVLFNYDMLRGVARLSIDHSAPHTWVPDYGRVEYAEKAMAYADAVENVPTMLHQSHRAIGVDFP